jgi:hypothetical protein
VIELYNLMLFLNCTCVGLRKKRRKKNLDTGARGKELLYYCDVLRMVFSNLFLLVIVAGSFLRHKRL